MSLKIKIILSAFVILALFLIIIRPYYLFLTQTAKISPLKALLSIGGPKTVNDRVNFVFLGVADASHDGPNLSDSITFLSYDFKTNRLTSIALPRDVWSADLKDKINAAYADGYATRGSENQPEAVKVKNGLAIAKAEIANVVGQPIQYAAAINFDQFQNLIDFLGGVDINVEKSFDDYAFPIPDDSLTNAPCGHSSAEIQQFTNSNPTEQDIWKYFSCRYEHIHFGAGLLHMDGATALIYVRSRHAIGPEGSDFAREARQEKVIEGVKDKLLAVVKKPDLNAYEKLYSLGDQMVKRDISNQELAVILKNIILNKNFQQEKIVLADDFFANPTANLQMYNYLWVLIPKDNKAVHDYVNCRLSGNVGCDSLKPK